MKIATKSAVVLAAISLGACTQESPDSAATVPGERPYVTLDADLTELKADFNEMSDKIRLVFVSGPSCGICLRGMDDLTEAIVGTLQNDPRVHTMVLYVPTLGAEEKHVAAAVPLMQGPRITHYWDPEGGSGIEFQETLNIPMYAWDVWLMYEPDVRWEADAAPPVPVFWQHQLPSLPKNQRLDADEFAAAVTARLAELPIQSAAPAGHSETGRAASGLLAVAQPRGVMIRQNHESRGGYDKLKTIAAIHYRGETDINGQTYPLTIETARPSRYRRTVEIGASDATVIWDGTKVTRTGTAPVFPPEIQGEVLASYEFDGLMTDWKDKGHSVRRLGMKKYGDRLPWLMEAELANGRTWHIYVDSHTGDAFRQVLISADGEETIALEFSDYRDADGFRLPHRIAYYYGDRLVATDRFDDVNVEVNTAAANALQSSRP
jgi:hypothetical protein